MPETFEIFDSILASRRPGVHLVGLVMTRTRRPRVAPGWTDLLSVPTRRSKGHSQSLVLILQHFSVFSCLLVFVLLFPPGGWEWGWGGGHLLRSSDLLLPACRAELLSGPFPGIPDINEALWAQIAAATRPLTHFEVRSRFSLESGTAGCRTASGLAVSQMVRPARLA